MKKTLPLLLISSALFFASCETTKEITFTQDNSGTVVNTMDMSAMIGMAKMSGQGKDLDKAADRPIDTTVALSTLVDSLKGISDEEKTILKKGKLFVNMNVADEKCIFKIELPFDDAGQISKMDKLSSKVMMQTLKTMMGSAGKGDDDENPFAAMPGAGDLGESSIDDYFTTNFSKGVIEKKLNKEKYAKVDEDKALTSMKEMSSMGIGNSTLVINLPRPAKKSEGKNITLSDDKKKITIKSSLEDFFDNATGMEFRIEY